MSSFRPIDGETGFLLPPSIEERLPEWHLARFVVEVVDGLDLRAMSGSYGGSGSASYHARLLPGLLIWGHATGQGNRLKPVGGPGRDCAGHRHTQCPTLSARRAPARFLPLMIRAIAAGVAWRVRRRGWAGIHV
jgi:hypothetical protein